VKLIYVGGPYRAATIFEISENIRRARARAVDVVRAGHYPLVPNLCTAMMDGLAPDDVFLAGALEMLSRSDEMWLVEGFENSHGTQAEIVFAFDLGKPVYCPHGHRLHPRSVERAS